jgi:hypothetical protein
MHRTSWLISAVWAAFLWAGPAGAAAPRFALVVGANHGSGDETPLRYAQKDAQHTAQVLQDAGGFAPENVVVLQQPTADRVREVLAHLNARIREVASHSDHTVLWVFYSGHADGSALHLGETIVSWQELRDLTSGSAAAVRLLVVDACRSGEATQVKGTRLAAPFDVLSDSEPRSEGFAILAAAAAGESAQESDALEASFFTYHLLSALRGAADVNHDGIVTLTEAYQYTSDRTLASSARTLAGLQHPTYHYAFKGRGDIALTRPGRSGVLSPLVLDRPGVCMVRSVAAEGALAAEVPVVDDARTLWLPPGPYFVQCRQARRLVEGAVSVPAQAVAWSTFRTVEYAQWARKGGAGARAVAAALALRANTGVLEGFPAQPEAVVVVSMDTPAITLDAEVSGSASALVTPAITTRLQTVAAAVGGRKAFDAGPWTFSLGLRAGAMALLQRYDTRTRTAPSRAQLAPMLLTLGRVEAQVWGPFNVAVEGGLRASLVRTESDASPPVATEPRLQAFGSVGVGLMW